jgi:N-acetylglucosamine kinase-like BadF-type ATPase
LSRASAAAPQCRDLHGRPSKKSLQRPENFAKSVKESAVSHETRTTRGQSPAYNARHPLSAATAADRCGGWGPLLGDEGSGHTIGLAALKAAMRAADGRGPDTILHAALLKRFGAARAADLVGCIHAPGVGRRDVADAAREVLAAADVGDAVAAAILTGAAAELATHVRTLAERNSLTSGVYPLRLTGGLLAGSATLRHLVVESLVASGHEPGSVTVVSDPAAAAARFAATVAVGC